MAFYRYIVGFACLAASTALSMGACSSTATTAATTDAGKTTTGDAAKKLPSTTKPAGADAGTGKKGATGSSTPTTTSKKAGTGTTGSTLKTPVADAGGGTDPCTGLPDGLAECVSDTTIAFCFGGAEYELDCNAYTKAEATKGGYDPSDFSGACFETDTVTDCLACFTDPGSGASVCCDFAGTICCDSGGTCYDPT